jgi:hypothetical protein
MPSAAAEGAATGPRPVSPAEAWQETRQGPIFKELRLPPLTEFPSLEAEATRTPSTAPAAAPAPAPMTAATAPAAPAAIIPPGMPSKAGPAPSPAPANPPPAAAAAPPPRQEPPKRNANDVFLSAKDLAAAFQLGFDGDTGKGGSARPGAAGNAEAPWADATFAEAPQMAPGRFRRPRRKRRVLRTVLVILLLSVGGAVAWLAYDPASRQRVIAWGEDRYTELTGADLHPDLARSRAGGSGTPATSPSGFGREDELAADRAGVLPSRGAGIGTPGGEPEAAPFDLPTRAAPTTRTTPPVPATTPTTTPATAPVVTPPAPSGGQAVAKAPIPAAPTPRVTRATQPAPAVVDVTPRPATKPAEPAKPSVDDARKRSRELWDEALRAEDSGDYGKAKGLYQQMMKLPREVWYQGVEARLRFAEEMLGEK